MPPFSRSGSDWFGPLLYNYTCSLEPCSSPSPKANARKRFLGVFILFNALRLERSENVLGQHLEETLTVMKMAGKKPHEAGGGEEGGVEGAGGGGRGSRGQLLVCLCNYVQYFGD